MLQTLPPHMQSDIKPPYEYHSYKPHPSRYSPPESPRTLPPFVNAQSENSMSNSHRGLPPPLGMSFAPPVERPMSSVREALGPLPAPPAQWTGQDESMRQWLQAKTEEDRRKQEEEKTKQEGFRLDQRKIEQTMLRESLQGGVPPPMVPLIFAGMGGGPLSNHTLEWAQEYLASLSLQSQQQQQQQQLQAQQQQQQLQHFQHRPSSEISRDHTGIAPNPYGPQSNQNVGQAAPPARIISGPSQNTPLSRLNTVDLQPQSVSAQQTRPIAAPPSSDQSSGPGLFIHHWTPPTNNQPPTPSGKSNQGSPHSQPSAPHLRSEYQATPKKRKYTGPQGPTSQPQDPSVPYSNRSSRDRETSPQSRSKSSTRPHSRQRSEDFNKDIDSRPIARPSSRQRRMDQLSGSHIHEPQRSLTGGSDDAHTGHFRHENMKAETR